MVMYSMNLEEAELFLMVVLLLILSKTAMVVVLPLNLMSMSCPIIETWCLVEVLLIPMSLWILGADLMVLVLSLNPKLLSITGPMVDVVEAAYNPVALSKTVDASDNTVFPIKGSTNANSRRIRGRFKNHRQCMQ